MTYIAIMAAVSSLAIGHSLFLSAYFWRTAGKEVSKKLLGALLLALAIRTGKALVGALLPGDPVIIPVLGLVGMSLIGPLVWLYICSVTTEGFQLNRRHGLHFLLPVAWTLSSPFYGEPTMFQAYQITVFLLLAYLVASGLKVRRYFKDIAGNFLHKKWLVALLAGIAVIWSVYLVQLYGCSFPVYFSVTTATALVLYGLSLWGIRQHAVFGAPVFSNGKPAEPEWIMLAEKTERLLVENELFRDPNLTLQILAQRHLKEPPYRVSKAVNAHFQKSFPDVLNNLRVRHAQAMLQNDKWEHLSVEAIAYESGFHSLSAFYAAFKKQAGMTPSAYRALKTIPGS